MRSSTYVKAAVEVEVDFGMPLQPALKGSTRIAPR